MSLVLPDYANATTPYALSKQFTPQLNVFTISGGDTAIVCDFTGYNPGTTIVNWQDGNMGGAGVMGQACVFVNASGVPTFGSYATTFNETGVVSAVMAISGSLLTCTISGKTTSTPATSVISRMT